jgi:hypothetical protein
VPAASDIAATASAASAVPLAEPADAVSSKLAKDREGGLTIGEK